MADFLAAKTPTEAVERRWAVPVDKGDAPLSVTLTASGVTIASNSFEGNELVLNLTGGTAAATASIIVAAVTEKGRTLNETLYIPIIASAAQIADTARDYVVFAMQAIGEPTAQELEWGLERLNTIVAEMREAGADIGAAFPIVASTIIYCPDYAVSALRYSLKVELLPVFGVEPTALDVERMRRGLQLVKAKNLPDVRPVEFF